MNRARALISAGEFQFATRLENNDFVKKYGLRDAKKKEMLLELTPDDCIDVSANNNPRYGNQTVFEFVKSYRLECYGELETVPVYAKMYILEKSAYDIVFVISLHEANRK